MSDLLKNKKGIIFGALDERSIAWKVAEKVHAQGGSFILSNAPIAMRMGKINELAEKCGTEVIPADATSMEDLGNLFDAATAKYGKLDFVLHSIGMSPNVRKDKAYTDLNHDWFQKTLDISALSFHKVLQTAYKKDAMNDWGSILALSYIAAQEAYPFYSDMADAKATLESIARSFGYHFGVKNKVRVNTISQSPTVTAAGSGISGFEKFFNFAEEMSPLGNADGDSCADYCVVMFSELTRYVTMQNLFHDGGYSTTGITSKVMEKWD
ncbi:MAG: SDR family oxidoreductase [Flavobacteriales bacterium]|nr:SDR family oxidoreductase [Flavobacteriales bacterium]